ncbi:MAG TPA: CBS domain-containing protein [Polyangiaceae bacterium]
MTDRSQFASTADALERLTAVRDHARVRAHLFSLDARQRWQQLESELASLEEGLARGGENALESATNKAFELVVLAEAFLERDTVGRASPSTPVQRVMTAALRSCGPHDTLTTAAQIMWDEDCGSVPVVDATGVLIAMLTDRDLCMACYTQGKPLSGISVASAMSRVTYSATQSATLADVIGLMKTHRVRRIPITNETGQLLGLVTVSDLLRHLPGPRQVSALEAALVDGLLAISEKRRPPLTLRTAMAAE